MERSLSTIAARVAPPLIWTVADLLLNGLVLLSVVRYRILRKRVYFLMISLSVCDILKVCVYIPYAAGALLRRGQTKRNFCLATSSLGIALLCCTTLHLMMESVNRILLIYRPFKHKEFLTKKAMAAILAIVWLLPFLFVLALPFALFTEAKAFKFSAKLFACYGVNVSNPGPTRSSYISSLSPTWNNSISNSSPRWSGATSNPSPTWNRSISNPGSTWKSYESSNPGPTRSSYISNPGPSWNDSHPSPARSSNIFNAAQTWYIITPNPDPQRNNSGPISLICNCAPNMPHFKYCTNMPHCTPLFTLQL